MNVSHYFWMNTFEAALNYVKPNIYDDFSRFKKGIFFPLEFKKKLEHFFNIFGTEWLMKTPLYRYFLQRLGNLFLVHQFFSKWFSEYIIY